MITPLIHVLLRQYALEHSFRVKGHYIFKDFEAATVLVGWVIGRNSGMVRFVAGLASKDFPKSKLNQVNLSFTYYFGAFSLRSMSRLKWLEFEDALSSDVSLVQGDYEPYYKHVATEIDFLSQFASSREKLLEALHRGTGLNPKTADLDYRMGFLTYLNCYPAFGFEMPDWDALGWRRPAK